MESASESGRIQCSRKTAAILRIQMPDLKLVRRGPIHVKGKGTMVTYWVNEDPPVEAPETAAVGEKSVRIATNIKPKKGSDDFRQYLRQQLDA